MILLIFSIISKSNSENIIYLNESCSSYLTFKVNGNGVTKIFYDEKCFNNKKYITKPDEVYIDDNLQEGPVKSSYDLNPNNIVKLIWENEIRECACMFRGCSSIVEINFTSFDTSKCSNMYAFLTDCHSLKKVNLSNFDTSSITQLSAFFWNCNSLISVDVSNFDTSKVIVMGHLFCGCSTLKSLDISNFNTSLITHIDNMFRGCTNLTSIDLSNFNTSKVISMTKMFHGCISLEFVNISSFDTSHVIDMSYLFYNCKLLTSINISNFVTTSTEFTDNMFNGCELLKIIDFSNFDSTSVTSMNDMFLNCGNLEYINFKNYNSDKTLDNNFFQGTPKNFVLCTESVYLINIIQNPECIAVNCSDNWNNFRKKINTKDNSCTDDCTKTEFQYEYNFKCYQSCLNGTYNNNYKCEDCHPGCRECEGPNNTNCISCSSPNKFLKFGNCVDSCKNDSYYYSATINQNICKCELENCYTCSLESYYKNLCTTCKDGYFPIYDNKYDNNNLFLNCSKSPEGYYLDNSVYKLCYTSYKTCNISGNETEHNCIECKDRYNFSQNIYSYKNCYENDSFIVKKIIEEKYNSFSSCVDDD